MPESISTTCCPGPALPSLRTLTHTPWRDLDIAACPACGALWLREVSELALGSGFDEVASERYARLAPEEAAALPAQPATSDLAFLADREVLLTAPGGGLARHQGWR